MAASMFFLDPTVIEEVSLESWRRLFDDVGWPASLDSKRDTFEHEDVLNSLRSDPDARLCAAGGIRYAFHG